MENNSDSQQPVQPRFGRGLAPALVSTLTELRRCDLPELAPGRHPIDGDSIFMDVMTLTTVAAAEKQAEMQQEYITLHLLISGEERIEYGLAGDGHREHPHAENGDLLLLDIKRHPQTLHMTHGMFAIFSRWSHTKPAACGSSRSKLRKRW